MSFKANHLHPHSHALQIFTAASEEGWGTHLGYSYCKRDLVIPRKQGGLFSPKGVPRPLLKHDNSQNNRHHHSCRLHKQVWMHEVRPSVSPTVENPDLVLQKTGISQGTTHSSLTECGSRQAIQAGPNQPKQSGLSFQSSSI